MYLNSYDSDGNRIDIQGTNYNTLTNHFIVVASIDKVYNTTSGQYEVSLGYYDNANNSPVYDPYTGELEYGGYRSNNKLDVNTSTGAIRQGSGSAIQQGSYEATEVRKNQ